MQPGPLHLLAGAAVASYDPHARSYNAPCWSSSRPHHQAARRALACLAEADADLRAAAVHLHRTTAPGEMFHPLVAALDGLPPALRQQALDHGRRLADGIRLLFHATDARLRPPRPTGGPPSDRGDRRILVVVPFRSTGVQPLRLRNLRACLTALDRLRPVPGVELTVCLVESDTEPRHRTEFEPRVDRYLFVPDGGPFNKALAVNTAVLPGGPGAPGESVCVLDADIVLEPDFLAAAPAAVPPGGALLPYQDAFCLDERSSDRMAALVDRDDGPDGPWSGYLIRRPPGGCVLVDRSAFHAVGGFDERFVGWGGEDRDLVDRLAARAEVTRLPGFLVHLMHERPAMREDRAQTMAAARQR
ncbi:hypothetical protein Kpho02_63690 [Kitasatospora phosalacinea]|uniref:Galactosyltransferase C-terminal domain-containing protein n=1 Tax=Kitasatospora phosalacinea TaxID=2065 RepID=A0A9W6V3V9_9ACTN|nr:galactosyltransferase-related protein [Kitasatospora phosalacinea]GLW74071.1 hypothetical protein Kpho02_63690 [Kitasatospora phosalacinea]